MKIKIPVPESLSEMTLEQYQKFEKINTEEISKNKLMPLSGDSQKLFLKIY